MSSEKDLPHDVVIEILSRLPVKTLLRFRCVCKSWYATITHPSFITTHLNRTSSYNNHGYLQNSSFDPNEKSKWCVFSDQSYVNHARFETPFNCRPSYYLNLVGSVNGILCLVDERTYFGSRTVYLWNPSIRKFKILPSPSTIHHLYSNRKNPVVFGFGFHRRSNDYKVVRIFYFTDIHENYNAQWPPQAEVYTLSTDSWRRIEAIVPCYKYNHGSSASDLFINGAVHWFACKSEEAKQRDMIMSFDIGDEVFGEMKLPEYYYLDGVRPLYLWLTLFEESLSLIACDTFPAGNSCCWIWVMREYGVVESWTKQFNVVVPEVITGYLCFTKNNELLLRSAKGKMISYDLKRSQLKYHRTRWSNTSNVVPCLETLVFLELEDAENSFYGKGNLRLLCKLMEIVILFFAFPVIFIYCLLWILAVLSLLVYFCKSILNFVNQVLE